MSSSVFSVNDNTGDSGSSFSNLLPVNVIRTGTSGPEPPLGTVIRRGKSVIGQDQLMATPSTSQNYEGGVTSEPNRVVNGVVPHAPEMLHSEDPNEEEIDEAFQNVFSGFSQAAEKEILFMLDADIVKHCVDHLRKSPLLICSFCHELFQDISPFQVHIQTCCSPPGVEIKRKMDEAAMNQLARSLWKSAFLKELQNTPIGQNLKQHEGCLHNELNKIWLSEPMLKCREIFIGAAVAIVSRSWVTNAVANELHRVRAIKPKQPKKRVKIDSDTDQSVADQNSSKSEKPSVRKKRKTRGRPSKSDRLVRGVPDVDLLAEAAKGFENLDNASDESSENEYVVGKILDRRSLLEDFKDFNPLEEDYEYLVSWEGCGEEDNTWEPYENLKHCTQKLEEYHKQLKGKTHVRCRRGKRI